MSQPHTYQPRSLIAPLAVPLFLVLIMWVVFLIEFETNSNFAQYGLKPRTLSGLLGIFTIPFLHGSWSHLINNTVPMLILGWALFKFYPTLAVKTLIWIYLMGGVWLWISGRSFYHIGASGIVYGMAAFLFFSGWLRREKRVAALSLLVAFMYGGMWWGILPVDPSISWEGHFWGGFAGIVLAFVFRKKGPQRQVYHWDDEDETEEENENAEEISLESQTNPPANSVNIVYSYKPSEPNSDKPAI